MVKIDLDLLKSQSETRFQKSLKKETRDSVDKKRKEDLGSIETIATLVEWATDRNIKIFVNGSIKHGLYDSIEKTIVLSNRLRPQKQSFVLLHELGHFLVEKNINASRIKGSAGYFDPGKKDRSLHFKIDCIDEELEAWNLGLQLANSLDLNIDMKKFFLYKVESIKTYLTWAIK